jgi:D-sedoheptulose 7-phosphate isomerase
MATPYAFERCLKETMESIEFVRAHLVQSAAVTRELADRSASVIIEAAEQIAALVSQGGKIMLCGNGGSAADCQHIAAEFTSRLRSGFERPGIPAIALTTDTSFLTARANDYGFDNVFERLVDAVGRPGDVLVAISTSGNSQNIARAVVRSKEKKIFTIGLSGGTGGALVGVADLSVLVPSTNTQHIQESHIAIGHVVCALVEDLLYGPFEDSSNYAEEVMNG